MSDDSRASTSGGIPGPPSTTVVGDVNESLFADVRTAIARPVPEEVLCCLILDDPRAVAAVLLALLTAGCVHQNAPHGFRGGSEKVPAILPAGGIDRSDQAEIRFVNEGGRIQRVIGPFVGHRAGDLGAPVAGRRSGPRTRAAPRHPARP